MSTKEKISKVLAGAANTLAGRYRTNHGVIDWAIVERDIYDILEQQSPAWISVEDRLPEDGVIVKTKIDDADGIRNENKLVRRYGIWFIADGLLYIYYTPTHWMPLPKDPK